jgi:hypothetical protein
MLFKNNTSNENEKFQYNTNVIYEKSSTTTTTTTTNNIQ